MSWSEPVTPTSTPTDTHTPINTPTPTKTHTPTRTPTITPTPTNTPTQTDTPVYTPTYTPTPATFLVGHVTWQGIPQPSNTPDPRNQMGITLTLRLASGGVASEYTGLTTDARGFFTVPVDTLAAGTYNWRAKGVRNLATSDTVSLPGAGGGTTQQEMGQQLAGDAHTTGPTNFNVVNSADFTTLKATFGKSIGQPGYDERADFNNDKVVNSADFTLLKGNFGGAGAPPIRPVRPSGSSGVEDDAKPSGNGGEAQGTSPGASTGSALPKLPKQAGMPTPASPSQPSQGQGRGSSAHRPYTITTVKTLIYMHADHLGSVALVTSNVGTAVSQQEFDPWGKVRTGNVTQTKRNFTGQQLDDTGLLFYNARYYDPSLARFLSADSIVPGIASGKGGAADSLGHDDKVQLTPLTVDFHESSFVDTLHKENVQILEKGFWFQLGNEDKQKAKDPSGPDNPQALNRYSYVLNNPLRYIDPTGHWILVRDINRTGGLALVLSRHDLQNLINFLNNAAHAVIGFGLLVAALGIPAVLAAQPEIAALLVGLAARIATLGATIEGVSWALQVLEWTGGSLAYTCLVPGVCLGGPYWAFEGVDPNKVPDGPNVYWVCDNGTVSRDKCGKLGSNYSPPSPNGVNCPHDKNGEDIIPGCGQNK